MHIHTISLNIEKLIGGTIHMDAVEFGAYMSLIIACYQSKNKLPKDDKRLARMARVSAHKWAKIKDVVLEKFDAKNDFYEQKFIKKDIQRMQSLSKKNRANALKRNETDQPVAQRSQSQNGANTNIQYPLSIEKDITNVISKKKNKVTLKELSISHIQDWLNKKRAQGRYLTIDEHRLLEKFKDYCTSKGKTYKDYVAGFRNSFEWNNAPRKGNGNGKYTNDDALADTLREIGEEEANSALDTPVLCNPEHLR